MCVNMYMIVCDILIHGACIHVRPVHCVFTHVCEWLWPLWVAVADVRVRLVNPEILAPEHVGAGPACLPALTTGTCNSGIGALVGQQVLEQDSQGGGVSASVASRDARTCELEPQTGAWATLKGGRGGEQGSRELRGEPFTGTKLLGAPEV